MFCYRTKPLRAFRYTKSVLGDEYSASVAPPGTRNSDLPERRILVF